MLSKKPQILLYDEEYFRYIFKKTEKIVSAVFYTTRSMRNTDTKDIVISDIEASARTLMETCHKTLKATGGSAQVRIEDLALSLIQLETTLTIGGAANCIDRGLLEVFRHEIDSLHRGLRKYVHTDDSDLFQVDDHMVLPRIAVRSERGKERSLQPQRREGSFASSGGVGASSGQQDRRTRIIDILRDKGAATIKDISTIITDCSEKTIQRELIGLIKDGIIQREGERRWSKYKPV
jgi:hypothetical protein